MHSCETPELLKAKKVQAVSIGWQTLKKAIRTDFQQSSFKRDLRRFNFSNSTHFDFLKKIRISR